MNEFDPLEAKPKTEEIASGSGLKIVKLQTVYPCCNHRHVRLKVVDGVPVQNYSRRCDNCGQKWEIEVVPDSGARTGRSGSGSGTRS